MTESKNIQFYQADIKKTKAEEADGTSVAN
jgi:hypothetical protein